MDEVLAGRIAAGVLGVAAVIVAFFDLSLAIVAAATAMALALVTVRDRRLPAEYPAELSHLLEDLHLRGPGHHVPVEEGVRLFVPADPRGPYLVPDVGTGGVQRDPPGSIGLALPAPGAALLEAWRELEGLPSGQGHTEVAHHIHQALQRLGLADRVHVERKADTYRIQFRLRDTAPAHAAQQTGWHLQGGCAASSLACALAALALQRPVMTASSALEPDGTLTLEVIAGTMA